MLQFVQNNKKWFLIGAGAAAAVGGLVWLMDEEETPQATPQEQQQFHQEQLLKQQQQQQAQQQQQQQRMPQGRDPLAHLSPEQKQQVMQERQQQLLKLREKLQQDVKITKNEEGLLTLQCVKSIFQSAIMVGINQLIAYQKALIEARQKAYGEMLQYVYIIKQQFTVYFQILNDCFITVVELLEIPDALFEQSRKYYINNKEMDPSYMRNICWHIMSDTVSQKEISEDEYVQYLGHEIKCFPEKLKELEDNEHLKKMDLKTKQLVLSSRIDDQADFDLKISENDAIKAMRKYNNIPRVKELYEQKLKLLEQVQGEPLQQQSV